MILVQRAAVDVLTATVDLGCLRHILFRLQRALHAAPQSWDTLPAVRVELAPWRIRLDVFETTLVGRLADSFAFLDGTIELRVG